MNLSDVCEFVGYEIVSEDQDCKGRFLIFLKRKESFPSLCNRCGNEIEKIHGRYPMNLRHMPIFEHQSRVKFWRKKGWCSDCKKIRSEQIPFVSEHSPHLTRQYTYWLSRLCEITTVKEGAEFAEVDDSSLWRLDKNILEGRIKNYKIPHARKIAVDEVSNRRADHFPGESRNEKFFTIITDLEARKVIWIADSRNGKALEDYFQRIGKEGCRKIKTVVSDQHPGYIKTIDKHLPHARHILDKFHLMRNFEEAINACRRFILKMTPNYKLRKLAQAKYRFIFLKKARERTPEEHQHLQEVMKENEAFYQLELIKERMFTFFDRNNTPSEAKRIMLEIRQWIMEAGFPPLKRWLKRFLGEWPRIVTYFLDPQTTSMAEGFNNVIKTLKKRAYGYRNMNYFRLKIMQKVGYLSSKYSWQEKLQTYISASHIAKLLAS